MSMYHLGREVSSLTECDWSELSKLKRELARTPVETILETIHRFSEFWANQDHERLIKGLVTESGFSEEDVRETLSLVPTLLNRTSLEKRLEAEFNQPRVLDQFVKMPKFQGLVRATPIGALLHVTAGNIFLGSLDSLLMGLITKNVSLVKVSSQNLIFPLYFARLFQKFDSEKILSNKYSILHWKGGSTEIETFIKSKVQGILAWGGEEMLASYKKDLPAGVKLLDFGPKVSFQVITAEGLHKKNLKRVAEAIVQDIVPWDQAACSSPQNLFIQESIDPAELLSAIDAAFLSAPKRGALSDDEATEILKEKSRALYSKLMDGGDLRSGPEHLIHFEKNKFLRPSPLNRSLIVKSFKNSEDLGQSLEPFSFYLQSCSYLLGEEEKDSFLEELALAGIKRFAPLGSITLGLEGAPHDGRFVLRELVNFIGDEWRMRDLSNTHEELQSSQDLKKSFENLHARDGYFFSSGGTTGEPKFVHFSYEEFDQVTDLLAQNFRTQGLRRGMTVANLFVAGNLWSSFLAVERALEKIGVIQLPIGGLCPDENTIFYLQKFRPDVVMGIPSLLVSLAEKMEKLKRPLEVQQVYYAGEALSVARKNYLSEQWKVSHFGSAGYASVDAGVIGYQCRTCEQGEHHLFDQLVGLEIIEDEGVVSSLYRRTLPIRRYRTGDRMKWMPQGPCSDPSPKFKLLGRIDNIIQIWSARISLTDIEDVLRGHDILSYQVRLRSQGSRELLDLFYECADEIDPSKLAQEVYENSRDLKDSLTYADFLERVNFHRVGTSEIKRNARTGKISLIVDQRV